MDKNLMNKEKRKKAIKIIEEFHNSGVFIVNGREYEISKLSHQFRTEVLATFSQIEANLAVGNYGFLMDKGFKSVFAKINDRILFDGMQISKIEDHFETHAEDFIDYIAVSMKVITYPFYKSKLSTA